jgi:hypothetical protein
MTPKACVYLTPQRQLWLTGQDGEDQDSFWERLTIAIRNAGISVTTLSNRTALPWGPGGEEVDVPSDLPF